MHISLFHSALIVSFHLALRDSGTVFQADFKYQDFLAARLVKDVATDSYFRFSQFRRKVSLFLIRFSFALLYGLHDRHKRVKYD